MNTNAWLKSQYKKPIKRFLFWLRGLKTTLLEARWIIWIRLSKAGRTLTLHVAGLLQRQPNWPRTSTSNTLHDNSKLPIILYNIPPRCGGRFGKWLHWLDLLNCQESSVSKDAPGDLTRPYSERALINNPFQFFKREHDIYPVAYNVWLAARLPFLSHRNVAPRQIVRVTTPYCREGKYAKQRNCKTRTVCLTKNALFIET